MKLFNGVKYVSTHGTSQGIIPRFQLHFMEMSEFAFPFDDERKKIVENFCDQTQDHFTNFYDVYNEVLDLRNQYIEGILNGKYFSVSDENGITSDISPEILIRKRIVDFFILGKQLLNNFCKSRLIVDGSFDIGIVLLTKKENIENYISKESQNFRYKNAYIKVIKIASQAQDDFLRDFIFRRGSLEHDYGKSIPDFNIHLKEGNVTIEEPVIFGENVFEQVVRYYKSILNLIEDIACYFFGVNAHINSKGLITLLKRNGESDPSKFKYLYAVTLHVNDPDLTPMLISK